MFLLKTNLYFNLSTTCRIVRSKTKYLFNFKRLPPGENKQNKTILNNKIIPLHRCTCNVYDGRIRYDRFMHKEKRLNKNLAKF